MATGVDFPQSNRTLGPPEGVTNEECQDLPVQLSISAEKGPCFISCWQLTEEELESVIQNGGKIYLWIMGSAHPMVCLTPHYAAGMQDLLGKTITFDELDGDPGRETPSKE